MSVLEAPSWRARAACKGQGEMFYSDIPEAIAAAKLICLACPVRPACRIEAYRCVERYGVRAGMAEAERADWHGPDDVLPDPRLPAGLIHGRNLYRSKWRCRCAVCTADYRAKDRQRKASVA